MRARQLNLSTRWKALQRSLGRVCIGSTPFTDPRLRVLLAHLLALAAVLVILAIQGPGPLTAQQALLGAGIVAGFGFLHVLTVHKRLALSTMALDAMGVVILLAGTGAPTSPFYVLALASVWWAAHVRRRHGGLVYATWFLATYVVLIGPVAFRDRLLVEALEDSSVVLIVGALSDWFVRVDRRALALNEALTVPPFGAEQLAIREGLLRALRSMDVPVDAVIAAGQVGLTAVQAELLAYLMLGLTNYEISDAIGVSEATVRYRLTRLYRTLGVRGRKQAAQAAHALGLSPPERRAG